MKEAIQEVDEEGWIIYRCPHCNAWDYTLQGKPGMVESGEYVCDVCGEEFEIP